MERTTVPQLVTRKKALGARPITMLTAYDFSMASLIDAAGRDNDSGVDTILVGDSAASVCQGKSTTLPITLEQMIYHTRCVTKGVKHALVIGDMPFLSYQISPERAVESAGRLIKEGGAHAVKLEGGLSISATVERIVACDIPVVGHVGLTPQSFHRMGGYRVQGKNTDRGLAPGSRERIIADAVAVEKAGVFMVVLECIPADLAAEITALLRIPTIGIGAGSECDGQVLVCNDMLGLTVGTTPSFVKRFAELGVTVQTAVQQFVGEVTTGKFPLHSEKHSVGPKKGS